MASKDEIRHRISLEGADDVARRLKAIGDVGSDAFKKVKQAAGDASPGFSTLEANSDRSRLATERLREAIHTIHPVLNQAGIGISDLGGFARLAGAGIAPLAAAIGGSLLVALAKLGEESQKTKERLKGLSGGDAAFEALSGQAKKLGTDVSTLSPTFEKYLQYRQKILAGKDRNVIHPPGYTGSAADAAASHVQVFEGANQVFAGGVPPIDKFVGAQGALFSGARKDTDRAAASSAVDAFFESLFSEGALKGAAVDALSKASPGAANTLATSLSPALGRNFANSAALSQYLDDSGVNVSPSAVISNLSKVEPQESARTVTEAFEGLAASAKRLAESFGDSGGGGLAKSIDEVSHAIDKITGGYDQFRHPNDYQPGGGKFIGPVRPGIDDVKPTDLLGRAVGFVREGGGTNSGFGGNPFGEIATFLKNALTNPGGLLERQRPETGPSSLAPQIDQTAGSRSDAGDLAQPQQLASLGEGFRNFIDIVAAALNRGSKNLDQSNKPLDAVGIRGWSGGHIRGPGGPRDDKIPAMLSDGEFVVNAEDTKRNRALLEQINAGKFADGGTIDIGKVREEAYRKHEEEQKYLRDHQDFRGNLSITYDPNTGGAYINGNLFLPGDPTLDDPRIKAAIERSKADMNVKSSSKASRHPFGDFSSPFGGGFKDGGLVGNARAAFSERLAALGFADGGHLDLGELFPTGGEVGLDDLHQEIGVS